MFSDIMYNCVCNCPLTVTQNQKKNSREANLCELIPELSPQLAYLGSYISCKLNLQFINNTDEVCCCCRLQYCDTYVCSLGSELPLALASFLACFSSVLAKASCSFLASICVEYMRTLACFYWCIIFRFTITLMWLSDCKKSLSLEI